MLTFNEAAHKAIERAQERCLACNPPASLRRNIEAGQLEPTIFPHTCHDDIVAIRDVAIAMVNETATIVGRALIEAKIERLLGS